MAKPVKGRDKGQLKAGNIAQNRKAHHDYFLEELFEAGIALSGTEVKSLRQGKCNLKESYVSIEHMEAYINGMHISPYEQGNIFNKDPLRKRKLLLHKREIRRLFGAVKQDGYTLVPTRLYFKGNHVKMEIALAKGKKLYDKREAIAKKDQLREAQRDYKIEKFK